LQKAAEENWSVRAMRKQIERKAYERKEIAQIQIKDSLSIPESTFKDPCFLDFLGLKEGYLENDLEGAILKEIELFILELGVGFCLCRTSKENDYRRRGFLFRFTLLSSKVETFSSHRIEVKKI